MFKPVSWDDAFDEIQHRIGAVIAQHGRDSLGVYLGNPNAHSHENALFLPNVIRAMGSRHVYSASTLDQMPKHVSSGLLFGDPDAIPVPDLDRTDFLLMLGANPMESNGSLCTAPDFPGRLRALRNRGGRLVVVDPRRTRTADIADRHLAILPGTDAHLLMGLARLLIEHHPAVSPGKLAAIIRGMDEIAVAAGPFHPQAVAAVTGIEPHHLSALAADLANSRTAVVYSRIGAHTTRFGTLAAWATDLLNILTGNLDRPGGAMFPLPGHGSVGSGTGRGFSTGRWSSRVSGAPEVRGEFPAARMLEEMETPGPGQLRALLTVAGNPVLSAPDSARFDALLSQLDVVVSVDFYVNETTRHANVILPPPGPLARSHYDLGLSRLAVRNVARWSPPLVAHEGPAEWAILARLAALLSGDHRSAEQVAESVVQARVTRAAAKLDRDPDELRRAVRGRGRSPADEILDVMLRMGAWGDRFGEHPKGISLASLETSPHGIDLGPLVPRLPQVLKTPDGRINLIPEEIRQDLRRLQHEMGQGPSPTLRLIGRRHLRSNNSWLHNVPALIKGKDRCTVLINPQDAAELDLSEDEMVEIRSRIGRLVAPIKVTDEIRRGVVSLPHGWGHNLPGTRLGVAAARPGVNSNLLTDPGPIDPLSGNAELNGIPIQIAKLPNPPSRREPQEWNSGPMET